MFRNVTLRRKIVLLGTGQLLVLAAVLFVLDYRQARQSAHDESLARARSIILTAESVREQMAAKWHLGLFTQPQVTAWAKQGDLKRVLASVPVVTAWESAMAKAKEGGYEFRTPRIHPRNAKNDPDPIELEALQKLESGQLSEYSVLDRERNAVRYFRPVRLSSECLQCHGDPGTSVSLWGKPARTRPDRRPDGKLGGGGNARRV